MSEASKHAVAAVVCLLIEPRPTDERSKTPGGGGGSPAVGSRGPNAKDETKRNQAMHGINGGALLLSIFSRCSLPLAHVGAMCSSGEKDGEGRNRGGRAGGSESKGAPCCFMLASVLLLGLLLACCWPVECGGSGWMCRVAPSGVEGSRGRNASSGVAAAPWPVTNHPQIEAPIKTRKDGKGKLGCLAQIDPTPHLFIRNRRCFPCRRARRALHA